MALGVPAVSTAFGVSGIAPGRLAGVTIVPDGDAEAFAGAVLALYGDPALRERESARAVSAARSWTAAQTAELRTVLARTRA